eukprot:maker-scaffold4199_size6427-snap-gene-0.1 protein:Tk00472 transcript:maker-scaffold4199_size6427-snap-gene-0.1-mRNA-1 annotation:"poly protein"
MDSHCESTVKAAKHLLINAAPDGNIQSQAFTETVVELRNSATDSGFAPAVVVFGHLLRSSVPILPTILTRPDNTPVRRNKL